MAAESTSALEIVDDSIASTPGLTLTIDPTTSSFTGSIQSAVKAGAGAAASYGVQSTLKSSSIQSFFSGVENGARSLFSQAYSFAGSGVSALPTGLGKAAESTRSWWSSIPTALEGSLAEGIVTRGMISSVAHFPLDHPLLTILGAGTAGVGAFYLAGKAGQAQDGQSKRGQQE